MTGKKRKKLPSKSSFYYSFVSEKDVNYSPFDGICSVPFVVPEEELSGFKSKTYVQKKKSSLPFSVRWAFFLLSVILFFIPSLKSDISVFELICGKDTLYVQSFSLEEICYGVDALKEEIIKEDRAYVKSARLLKQSEETALKVSKTVSTEKEADVFIWPTKGAYAISSPYGYRDPEISGFSFHGGIDIVTGKGNSTGVPVVAAKSGTVIYVSESYRGYGHQVLIDHGQGITTRYAHMKPHSILVSTGEKVKAGQQIGKIGSTGNTTGPHLHFEVLVDGVKVEPKDFLTR